MDYGTDPSEQKKNGKERVRKERGLHTRDTGIGGEANWVTENALPGVHR